MEILSAALGIIGAFAFGGVIGWISYYIMRRAKPSALSDLSTVIGALGGATIIGLFSPTGITFGAYGLGLAAGFFGYYRSWIGIVGDAAFKRSQIAELQKNETTILSETERTTAVVESPAGDRKNEGEDKYG